MTNVEMRARDRARRLGWDWCSVDEEHDLVLLFGTASAHIRARCLYDWIRLSSVGRTLPRHDNAAHQVNAEEIRCR